MLKKMDNEIIQKGMNELVPKSQSYKKPDKIKTAEAISAVFKASKDLFRI